MELKNKRGTTFVSVVSGIGVALIFVGIAWLIATNWHQIPDFLKVLILVFSTLAAFISGVLLKERGHKGVGRALITLGALLYMLSLFLISQIYHLATTMQSYAWLLFFSWTVILISAYFVDSRENLGISLILFFIWVFLQYTASIGTVTSAEGLIFVYVLILLSAGSLFYGLSILHNSLKHNFTNIYHYGTIFYTLLIFYILSFQTLLPLIGSYTLKAEAFTFFSVLFVILCFSGFVVGALLAVSRTSTSINEILGFIGVLAVLFFLILSTKFVGGEANYSFLGRGAQMSAGLWFWWLVNNIVFIGMIILVSWYGQYTGATDLIDLALVFFVLEIITRYIGFWAKFRGYFAFSVLAILGGILLILGALFIPKWKRRLAEEIEKPKEGQKSAK